MIYLLLQWWPAETNELFDCAFAGAAAVGAGRADGGSRPAAATEVCACVEYFKCECCDQILKHCCSIWEHLLELARTSRITIVITTHYIEEARQAHTVRIKHDVDS